MKKEEIEKKISDILSGFMDSNSYELVEVEYIKEAGQYFLRVYIDKEGGVTVDDCVTVSRYLDPVLDSEDFIKEEYRLQVSSPGLDRALKTDRDFEKYKERLVELKLYEKRDGKKEYEGKLLGRDEGIVKIEDESGSILSFTEKEISVIKLKVVIK